MVCSSGDSVGRGRGFASIALVRMLVMRSPLVDSSGASEKERRDPAIDILVLLGRRLIIFVVVVFMLFPRIVI